MRGRKGEEEGSWVYEVEGVRFWWLRGGSRVEEEVLRDGGEWRCWGVGECGVEEGWVEVFDWFRYCWFYLVVCLVELLVFWYFRKMMREICEGRGLEIFFFSLGFYGGFLLWSLLFFGWGFMKECFCFCFGWLGLWFLEYGYLREERVKKLLFFGGCYILFVRFLEGFWNCLWF